MAIDKAVDSSVLNAGLTSVADAIRTKGGTSAQLAFPGDYIDAINAISTTDASDLYAGASAPTGAAAGDYWLDTSDEGGLPSSIAAGDTPVLASSVQGYTRNATGMEASGIYVIVPKAGTYRFKFSCARTTTSGTYTSQLYKNGAAVSGATATWSSRQGSCVKDIACNANDRIEIYCRSGATNNYVIVGQLIACIDWNIWGA